MALSSEARKHQAAVWESRATPDELLQWANEQYTTTLRWPTRRYRVHNEMGASRLLSDKEVRDTVRKYGGRVEEAIPAMEKQGRSGMKPYAR